MLDTERILARIEQRAAYVLLELRFAVSTLLNLPTRANRKPNVQVTLDNLEARTEQWAFFVPPDPVERAALAFAFGKRYSFTREQAPKIALLLGVDDPAVRAAFLQQYGQPFEAIFSDAASVHNSMMLSTVSRKVDEIMRDDLGSELRWVTLKRGEVLFRQGEPGDSLYVIISGLVLIERGSHQTPIEVGRGEIIGEISLLTGDPRSATVIAARDTQMCQLSRAGLDRLVMNHPQVIMQIALHLAKRVQRGNSDLSSYPKPVTMAIVPISPNVDVSDLAARLAAALERYGATLHVHERMIAAPIGWDNTPRGEDDHQRYELDAWLNEQETRHRFILYQADHALSEWTTVCVRHADRLLLVADQNASPALSAIEASLISRTSARISVELLLLQPHPKGPFTGTELWLAPRQIKRHHHLCADKPQDIERLARLLSGHGIGLVLGGGGMRGAAHIGVIRALTELGITVDMVGGTSAGALIAALYAMEWNADDILKTATERLFSRRAILDFTVPVVSLAAAHRISKSYREIFGDLRIEDLRIPFFSISSNLTRAAMMVHHAGLLRRYVRASTSLPVIYPPVTDENGDLLVDGALFNNLPVSIMRSFLDGGTVIAVDVGGSEPISEKAYNLDDSLSGWKVLRSRFDRSRAGVSAPDIMTILTRTIMVGSASTLEKEMERADLMMRLPMNEYGLFDVESLPEMAEAGYHYALTALRDWQKTSP